MSQPNALQDVSRLAARGGSVTMNMWAQAVCSDFIVSVDESDVYSIECIANGELEKMEDFYVTTMTMVTSNAVMRGCPWGAAIAGVNGFKDTLAGSNRPVEARDALKRALNACILLMMAEIEDYADDHEMVKEYLRNKAATGNHMESADDSDDDSDDDISV